MTQKIRKAVIPAAGFGTRFLPATKAMPKEMLPIVDKPVIQYVVEELVEAGIEDIIIVTGYHKRSIEDHFDAPSLELVENLKMGGPKKEPLIDAIHEIASLANFYYVRQKGPYGNGTPLLNVRNIVGNEPFLYLWGDDFFVASPSRVKQLLAIYEKYGCSCFASVRAKSEADFDRYGNAGGTEIEHGVIDIDAIIEKPGKQRALSDICIVSGYLFTPDIFDYIERVLTTLPEGDELYYNDALKLMLSEGKRMMAVEIKDGKYYDTGNKLEFMKTAVDFALKHADIRTGFLEHLRTVISSFEAKK